MAAREASVVAFISTYLASTTSIRLVFLAVAALMEDKSILDSSQLPNYYNSGDTLASAEEAGGAAGSVG